MNVLPNQTKTNEHLLMTSLKLTLFLGVYLLDCKFSCKMHIDLNVLRIKTILIFGFIFQERGPFQETNPVIIYEKVS